MNFLTFRGKVWLAVVFIGIASWWLIIKLVVALAVKWT